MKVASLVFIRGSILAGLACLLLGLAALGNDGDQTPPDRKAESFPPGFHLSFALPGGPSNEAGDSGASGPKEQDILSISGGTFVVPDTSPAGGQVDPMERVLQQLAQNPKNGDGDGRGSTFEAAILEEIPPQGFKVPPSIRGLEKTTPIAAMKSFTKRGVEYGIWQWNAARKIIEYVSLPSKALYEKFVEPAARRVRAQFPRERQYNRNMDHIVHANVAVEFGTDLFNLAIRKRGAGVPSGENDINWNSFFQTVSINVLFTQMFSLKNGRWQRLVQAPLLALALNRLHKAARPEQIRASRPFSILNFDGLAQPSSSSSKPPRFSDREYREWYARYLSDQEYKSWQTRLAQAGPVGSEGFKHVQTEMESRAYRLHLSSLKAEARQWMEDNYWIQWSTNFFAQVGQRVIRFMGLAGAIPIVSLLESHARAASNFSLETAVSNAFCLVLINRILNIGWQRWSDRAMLENRSAGFSKAESFLAMRLVYLPILWTALHVDTAASHHLSELFWEVVGIRDSPHITPVEVLAMRSQLVHGLLGLGIIAHRDFERWITDRLITRHIRTGKIWIDSLYMVLSETIRKSLQENFPNSRAIEAISRSLLPRLVPHDVADDTAPRRPPQGLSRKSSQRQRDQDHLTELKIFEYPDPQNDVNENNETDFPLPAQDSNSKKVHPRVTFDSFLVDWQVLLRARVSAGELGEQLWVLALDPQVTQPLKNSDGANNPERDSVVAPTLEQAHQIQQLAKHRLDTNDTVLVRRLSQQTPSQIVEHGLTVDSLALLVMEIPESIHLVARILNERFPNTRLPFLSPKELSSNLTRIQRSPVELKIGSPQLYARTTYLAMLNRIAARFQRTVPRFDRLLISPNEYNKEMHKSSSVQQTPRESSAAPEQVSACTSAFSP